MNNLSTTFSSEIIPQINKVLKFVLENPYSDFYRNKYRDLGIEEIKSYGDFQKIPFLTKDEFLVLPLKKRTFVPEDEIKHYSFSSGTTNYKIPTIIPHLSFDHEDFMQYFINEKKIKALGVRRIMILSSPLSPPFLKYLTIPRKSIVMVPGDENNLDLSAKIAEELKIQGIMTSPTKLYFFIKYLIKNGFNLKHIKWIHIGGEFCSLQKFQYFKSVLPNALVNTGFATSETNGPRGYRCEYLANNERPNIFHSVHKKLVEIADDENKILPLERDGELIHTDLRIRAFPLIRYKTKDIGSLMKYDCPCGNNLIINLGGRINFDVLRFSGVTLYANLIADAIGSVKEFLEPQFQMHVFEEKTETDLKPKLQLHVKLKKSSENLKDDPVFKKNLAYKISDCLKLSGKSTLKQLAEQGIFLPLEIVFIDSWPEKEAKTKNIISHLN